MLLWTRLISKKRIGRRGVGWHQHFPARCAHTTRAKHKEMHRTVHRNGARGHWPDALFCHDEAEPAQLANPPFSQAMSFQYMLIC